MFSKRSDEHSQPLPARHWFRPRPATLIPVAICVFALGALHAWSAERATTALSGLMDTPARVEALKAKVEVAIGNGETVVSLESKGGMYMPGWELGERLHTAGIKVRCVGVCGSSAAQILLASRGCIVSMRGRVVLHAPVTALPGLAVTTFAVIDHATIEDWRNRMTAVGVPNDVLDRTLWEPNRQHELSTYEMKRVGCVVE